ncbi:unnamed protein product [Peniophora sp. CBMAI 1063]|nr:unnamed protein product [Peniophora sp. CBMAI 1063]
MDYTTQLPVETLCAIFESARDANPSPGIDELLPHLIAGHSRYTLRVVALAWIPGVTHVCSRWRTAAVSDPSLWTQIPVMLGLHWLRTFLSRSRADTVTIDWKSLERMDPDEIQYSFSRQQVEEEVISHHSERLRNLIAVFDDHKDRQLLCRPWPVLEDLEVSYSAKLSTPLGFFNREFPSLRRLTWRQYSSSDSGAFLSQALSLGSLTYLRLVFARNIDGWPINTLLDVLGHLTMLRHLQIGSSHWHMRTPRPRETRDSPRRVQGVPSLRTLLLHTTYDEMNHFLLHVDIPVDVKLQLKETSLIGTGEDMTSALLSMKHACTQLVEWYRTSPDAPPFIAADVALLRRPNRTYNSNRAFHARLSRSAIVQAPSPSRWDEHIDGRHADLDIECQFVSGHGIAMFLTILHVLAPQSLRSLSIDVDHIEFADIVSSFDDAAFQTVVALHFPRLEGACCIQSLNRQPSAVHLFPSLRLLACPAEGLWDALSLVPNTVYGSSQDLLANLLAKRRTTDTPICAAYFGVADEVERIRHERNPSSTSCGRRSKADWVEIRRAIDLLEAMPEVRLIQGGRALENEVVYIDIVRGSCTENIG